VNALANEGRWRVYGSDCSYYTGKLEAYLKYKEIPYDRIPATFLLWNRTIPKRTGAMQMPAVELPDGRWMTDTTPIIEWAESQRPTPAVIPADPLQAWFSRFVEDYAEEWLWRPAMHYRWSYEKDALLMSRRLADEILGSVPAPGVIKRNLIRRRQFQGFVRGDGVDHETRPHVEGVYLSTLDSLQAVFDKRAFLLGDVPTLADYGFFASMFRHFGIAPTPGAIMLDRAPAVYEWLGRVWNARASRVHGDLLHGIPDDWSPILHAIGNTYLPYLSANAEAWKAKKKRFDVPIENVIYRRVPISRYRVWCLERLREEFQRLPESVRGEARSILEAHGCWYALWHVEHTDSGYDREGRAPFGPSIAVFGG
jgi:glutathione S-transferase